ncbi:hypothetical protein FDW97_15575, partial [Citrobacter sp. wls708]
VRVSFPAPNSYLKKNIHNEESRWGRFVSSLTYSCKQTYPQVRVLFLECKKLRLVNSIILTH